MSFFADPGTVEALKWLVIVFAISIAMRPYLNIKHLTLWDNGFGLSFGLGTALTFLGAWFVSACGLFPFDTILAYVSFAIFAVAPFIYCKITKQKYSYWDKNTIRTFLIGFIIFAIIFLLAVWVVGYNPLMDETTENYMDYGFMESMYRWKQVPPEDIWYAGSTLNYYYMGQAAAVFLCRLAFTSPEYGYNLMICTILAGLFLMVSEVAYAIIIACQSKENPKPKKLPAAMGAALAALSACFAGNGYWVVEGAIKHILNKIKGIPNTDFFFAYAVSYISPENGALDNGRTEFPSYSLVLGDLHAHLVNVLFVLPLLIFLLDYANADNKKDRRLHLILISILLGLYKGTNFWDFAIYIVITFGTVIICSIKWNGLNKRTFYELFVTLSCIYLLSLLSTLPFSLQFEKISSIICFSTYRTPFIMLIVLWAVPITISIILGIWLFKSDKLNMTDSFRLGLMYLLLCAVGLIMSPEVLYIKDIYGDTYARFNTMFKLTYQAYILFAIVIGVSFAVLLMNLKKQKLLYLPLAFVAIYSILNLAYTPDALKDRYFYQQNEDGGYTRIGLSTAAGLSDSYDYIFDKACADTLKEDESDDLIILEGSGKSYSHADAVSCLSGIPTVLGWETHEWLWKDSYDVVYERQMEIQQFYENGDTAYCQEIIDKYGIDYIVLGSAEYSLYNVNTYGFMELGQSILEMDSSEGKYMLIQVNH